MSNTHRGIVYFAVGQKYLTEAINSAKTVRQQMPDLPLAIFSDVPAPPEIFTYCLPVAADRVMKRQKMYALSNTPFQQTLYLDTDTYLTAPVYELFEMIDDGYSFAAALSPWWGVFNSGNNHELREKQVPISFAKINSGLILYDNVPQVQSLFVKWDELYVAWGNKGQDQDPLRVALYFSDLRWIPLPPAYNFRSPFPAAIRGQIKVLHGRHAQLERLSKVFNYTEEFRAFVPHVYRLNTLFIGERTIKPSFTERFLTFLAPYVSAKIRDWRRQRMS